MALRICVALVVVQSAHSLTIQELNRICVRRSRPLYLPNVVHSTWFNSPNASFLGHKHGYAMHWEHVLSMMSVRFVVRPREYVLYTDNEDLSSPHRPLPMQLECARRLVDQVVFVNTSRGIDVNGRSGCTEKGGSAEPSMATASSAAESETSACVDKPAHRSDVVRLQKLYDKGGIYIDHDAYVMRPLDELRRASRLTSSVPAVIAGSERDKGRLNNGVLIAPARAPLICIWMDKYRTQYHPHQWDFNSCKVPYKIVQKYPELISDEQGLAPFPENMTDTRAVDHELGHRYVVHLTGLQSWSQRQAQVRSTCLMRRIMDRIFQFAASPSAGGDGGLGIPAQLKPCVRHVQHYLQKDLRFRCPGIAWVRRRPTARTTHWRTHQTRSNRWRTGRTSKHRRGGNGNQLRRRRR